MQSKQLAGGKAAPAVKRFLDIAEVKEDVVIMKDGTLRAVLFVSSINFALKSEDEQNAVISQYVQFLNSLEYPLQVVIQSRKLNVEPYLEKLKEQEREQENELLRMQIADYRAFVTELVSIGQIMQKRFFVIVPYNPASDKRKSFWERLQGVLQPAAAITLQEEKFRERKQALMIRAEHIQGSLQSMGLKAKMLDTQGLIELYYTIYNPEVYDVQPMGETDQMRVSENVETV
ncbi:hypothetical protein AMJ57_05490 [Parcubacteria bacterium SG8_24]|nr:MAG: hypothetical protein AMJ57_05490 [Parcubacteria bacterium SG8_24]